MICKSLGYKEEYDMGLILGGSVIGALFLALFVTIGIRTLYKHIQVRTNGILNNQKNYSICNLSHVPS